MSAVGLWATDAGAHAPERPFFDEVWASIEAQLTRAVAENRRKPPQPVTVKWKKKRLGAIDLGAPVLDIVASDLDGDSKDELVALTTTHVVVLRKSGRRKIQEVARLGLPDKTAPLRSRSPVGMLFVADGGEIRARTSDQAEGIAASFDGKKLSEARRLAGWPLCADGTAELAGGRNYFDLGSVAWTSEVSHRAIDTDFVSARCRSGLVDPAGDQLEMFGFVDVDDSLVVRCRSELGKCDARETVLKDVGYAFELADVDNDGHPEVVTTSTQPYGGTSDRVTIRSQGGSTLFSKTFGGGVVGVCAGDIDGDGAREVIAVVRLVGATRVNVWTLN